MTETYKLTYFDAKGSAEPIRYILAVGGVEYEDIRLAREDWPAIKPKTRWGQVPFMQIGDQELGQSATISRYFARKFNLVGETPMEAARADEIVDTLADYRGLMRPFFIEQDAAKKVEIKKALLENEGKLMLTKFSAMKDANGGKWIIGKNMTWADIYVAHMLEFLQMMDPDILKAYPSIEAIQKEVFNVPQIKAWIQKRPKSLM